MLALRSAVLCSAAQRCWHALTSAAPQKLLCAQMSSATNLEMSLDSSSGIATIKMSKKPVNSLDKAMLSELLSTFEKLESDSSCRGVILTSSLPRMFSAGLELSELYQPNPDKLRVFWNELQELWIKFYGTRLATVAAINGHSPAGGCLLSLCADYRIMASGKFTIGLNESHLGFPAPSWLMDTMVNTIGFRRSEDALMLGRLFNPEEALKIGLVDEVVQEAEVLDAANKAMAKYLSIPDISRSLTKTMLRDPTIQRLAVRKKEALEDVVKLLSVSECQQRLVMYIKALKERKK